MLAVADTKNARIEFKTSREVKQMLQGAAKSLGMDLSSFLLSTATQRAREVLKDEKVLLLSEENWKDFETYLHQNKEPSQALKDLMKLEPLGA